MRRSLWQDNYQHLRQLLKKVRVNKNITQIELSHLLNKPQSFVSKYENGERGLDIIELIYICNAMDCNVFDLVREIEKKIKENL